MNHLDDNFEGDSLPYPHKTKEELDDELDIYARERDRRRGSDYFDDNFEGDSLPYPRKTKEELDEELDLYAKERDKIKNSDKCYVIGICGASCSGKSKAAHEIANAFDENVTIMSQDSYYVGGGANTNYDVPEAIDFPLLIKDLKKLISGKQVNVPVYDFTTHSRSIEIKTLYPTKIIILEGILIFTQKEVRDLLSLKVFISVHDTLAFSRRLKRDVNERKRSFDEVSERYLRDVLPSCKFYVEPSENHSDIVLKNNVQGQFIGLNILLDHIRVKLTK